MTQRDCSRHRLARWVGQGEIVRVLPGVYLRADVAGDLHRRAAAVARWNPAAVVWGAMAARLTFWPTIAVPAIDVAAPTHITSAGYRFSRRSMPADLCTYLGDLRVAGPALTAVDLAVETDGESIDQVLRSRLVRIDDLRPALALTRGRRGNSRRARLLLDSRAEPWSAAERIAHRLLHTARIGGWSANAPVRARGNPYFIDIAFERERLAVEIDGREFHTKATVFETDRTRQNDLVLDRWTVLRFTHARLVDDPDGVIADVRLGRELAQSRAA